MSSRTAEAPLRLLHLEDSELDHALTLAHLHRGGLRVESQRVDSEADFLLALERPWDVIVSDYNLPGFSGLVALDLLMADPANKSEITPDVHRLRADLTYVGEEQPP